MYQGIWIALRSTLRLTLALQTIGPVVWTELGQYCCNSCVERHHSAGWSTASTAHWLEAPPHPPFPTPPDSTPAPKQQCNDHTHSDWFTHNVINLAAQLDVSWSAWAWRGQGEYGCGYPDVQGSNGVLTDGVALGGANWAEIWATFMGA